VGEVREGPRGAAFLLGFSLTFSWVSLALDHHSETGSLSPGPSLLSPPKTFHRESILPVYRVKS
jgi:hypothetical protein